MKITKLVLHKYKRFFLNEIEHLEYTPEAPTQIILGQNGSGKSSLVQQLTPLPANVKKDFYEGGYKEITILHEDKLYKLTNGVNGTKKHSFLIDGIEHNDSGTFKVQTRLVEIYFNITPQLHQIQLGQNKFTQMSPTERKKWLTSISNIDYSYPIGVYVTLKNKHRDILGGIKLTQNDIVKYEKSSMSKEYADFLEKEKKHYTVLIDHLLSLTSTLEEADSIDSKINEVKEIVDKINKIDKKYSLQDIDSMSQEVTSLETKRNILKESLIKLNKKLENFNNLDIVNNKREILVKIEELKKSIDTIKSSNSFNYLEDPKTVCDYLDNNYSDIIGVLSQLGDYYNVDISKAHIQVVTSELNQNKTYLETATRRQIKLEEHYEHLKSHFKEAKDIECPKCGNIWRPDADLKDIDNIKKNIIRNHKRIEEFKKLIDKYEKELKEIEHVRSIVSNFIRYFSHNNDTRTLLNYIKNNELYLKDGHSALFNIFESMYAEIMKLRQLVNNENELEVLNHKLNLIIEKEKFVESITDTKESLETEILDLQHQLLEIENSITIVKNNINKASDYIKYISILESKIKEVYKVKNDNIEVTVNEELKKVVFKLRMDIMEIETQLKSYYEYDTRLSMLQKQLDELSKKEKVLKLLCEELSPSTGLIAKSIESFINAFVGDMNHLINYIWGYDMEILGCDIEEGNLDYKFKVLVNNDEIIEDISKTSSGMKEIIDLVFVIVFSKYKGFMNYPLLLDEFGKTLDAQHRITAYEAIDRIISKDFSQIFIVSHFESMYGRFGTADVNILGTAGVDINTVDEYNKVLKIN